MDIHLNRSIFGCVSCLTPRLAYLGDDTDKTAVVPWPAQQFHLWMLDTYHSEQRGHMCMYLYK